MSLAQILIDKACKSGISRRQLASMMGEDQAFLSRVATGKAPLPPSLAARLAERTGDDPTKATLIAVVSQEKDPARRDELARLYGLDLPQSETISAQGPDGLSYVYSKTYDSIDNMP